MCSVISSWLHQSDIYDHVAHEVFNLTISNLYLPPCWQYLSFSSLLAHHWNVEPQCYCHNYVCSVNYLSSMQMCLLALYAVQYNYF